jgi:hypothetical protein
MKNYKESDYALNKHSGGIVYRFADKIVEVTLTDYLVEYPDKTAEDFRRLKEFSDKEYLEQDRIGYQQTWKNTPLDALENTEFCSASSPEELFINAFNMLEVVEQQKNRTALAKKVWDKFTEVQRRRYLLYHVEGLIMRKIAEIENVSHTSVVDCL